MKKMKRIMMVFAAFAIMVSASLFMTKDVAAAAKAPKFAKSKIDVFLVDGNSRNYYYSIDIANLKAGAVITDVKSSRPGVISVSPYYGGDEIRINPIKKGKAVISCKVKQNGKTYKLKKTVNVYKGNPLKYVKVNNKQVYSKGRNCIDFYTAKKKVKISYKLKSGWKIKRMYYNYHNYKGKIMSKNYKMKNGDKIKIGKGSHTSVKIDAVNKKGQVFRFLVMLFYDADYTEQFYAPVAEENVLLDGTIKK